MCQMRGRLQLMWTKPTMPSVRASVAMLTVLRCFTTDFASSATLDDPYAIFAKARQHWEAAHYPAQMSYNVVITVTHADKESTAHYRSYYDARSDVVTVMAAADEELAAPYTPHGINTFLNLFGSHIPISAPQRTFDYLGVPVLAPNYAFGMVESAQAAGPDTQSLVNEIRGEYG